MNACGFEFGSAMSETASLLLSGEILRIFPTTPVFCVTAGAVAEAVYCINPLVPSSPKSVPMKAFVPSGLKIRESGVAGNVISVPRVFAGGVTGTSVVKQPVVD
jgi:hypothetical protein